MSNLSAESIIDNYVTKFSDALSDNIIVGKFANIPGSGWPEDGLLYHITCTKCGTFQKVAVVEWSKDGGLDFLFSNLLQFDSEHKHEPESPPERVFRMD